MPTKIIGCGGRDFLVTTPVATWIRLVFHLLQVDECVDGGARGADTGFHVLAIKDGVDSVRFFANWVRYDKTAGPIRNKKQLSYLLWATNTAPPGTTPLVIALPGGRGTENMIAQAVGVGCPVLAPTENDFRRLPITAEELYHAHFCHR